MRTSTDLMMFSVGLRNQELNLMMFKLMKSSFIQVVSVILLFSFFLTPTESLKVMVPREMGFVDGEDVPLPCTFTLDYNSGPIDLSKLEVKWINGATILTYKNLKIEPSSSYKGRVMMSEQNLRNGDATLILTNVTRVDMLTCIVTYNGETQSDTIVLNSKLFVQCPKSIEASPGEESTFTCNFSSGSHEVKISIDFPAFSIECFKDSNKSSIARFSKIGEHYKDGVSISVSEVPHGTFSITFQSVKPDDYDYYTCKVNYPHCIQGSAVTVLYMGSEEKHKKVFSGRIIGGVTFVILLVVTGVAVWCYLLKKAKGSGGTTNRQMMSFTFIYNHGD